MYSPLSALLIFYSGRHFTFKLYRLYGLFSIKFLSTQHFNLSLFLSYLHSISSLFYFSNYYIYISVQPLLSLSLSLSLLQLTCELIWCGLSRTESIKVWRAKNEDQTASSSFLTYYYLSQSRRLVQIFFASSSIQMNWKDERERERERERDKGGNEVILWRGLFLLQCDQKKIAKCL